MSAIGYSRDLPTKMLHSVPKDFYATQSHKKTANQANSKRGKSMKLYYLRKQFQVCSMNENKNDKICCLYWRSILDKLPNHESIDTPFFL